MKILYISTVCTPKVLDFIFETSIVKPSQSVQKFHRLLIEGLAKHTDFCQVEVLTSLPVSPGGHKKIIWNLPDDKLNGIPFRYIPFINLPIIKHIVVFFYTFLNALVWILSNRKNEKVVVCDILNVSVVWATFIACKICRQNIAVIITDLPFYSVLNFDKESFLKRTYLKISSFILKHFDFYIGLTQQMNEIVNPNNKPFMVMEGLVDCKITASVESSRLKYKKKIVLYAGGIFEEFGVKKLLDAFLQLKGFDLELHIYGSGDLEKEMPKYAALDKRIIYHGLVNNSLVVQRLVEATVLINPRPTTEEFTKFSFPSKNMEYMVSGTPLLTTKLPGMPSEYNDYVYLIEDESVAGMHSILTNLLSKSDEELQQFGDRAQSFVLKNKSNEIQAKRIVNFLIEN
jgi:glycosyltransferase involved in cell wall biosynthesis